MERSFFPSKPSFALFIWLAIFVSFASQVGMMSQAYTKSMNVTQQVSIKLVEILDSLTPQITVTGVPSKKALPFDSAAIPKNDLQCMAENIYYEAGNQSYVGKMAVGLVVLNRVRSPNYPSTICGVIYEGSLSTKTTVCQFSWLCEPDRKPINRSSQYWIQSLAVATELLNKRDSIVDITEGAVNYHANYVNPTWSKTLKFITQIDQHLFYKTK